MIPRFLATPAMAALTLVANAAPAIAQSGPAYYDAVGGCLSVIEAKAAPDPSLSRAGLAPQTQPHARLKQFFYPTATDLRWYSRRLDQGVVHIGTSSSDASCTVFLLGVPGEVFNKQVAGRFAAWNRQQIDGGVAFSRRSLFGDTVVVSIHDGPPTVQPEQIGAMVKIYVLPKN